MESSINHTFVMNDAIYAASLLSCYCEPARCVCRLRVHKVSKQVNWVSNHQRMNAISALLRCNCISVSWNFLPQTSRKFFAELFRKSTVIFPEISRKIPQEISKLTTLSTGAVLLWLPPTSHSAATAYNHHPHCPHSLALPSLKPSSGAYYKCYIWHFQWWFGSPHTRRLGAKISSYMNF